MNAPPDRRGLLGRIDADVPRWLIELGIPSVSIAHVEGGRIEFAQAYGAQSPGVPATRDSVYNVASLTKPVTAEVILRLASKGVLSLDEAMYPIWVDPDLGKDERHKLLTPRISLAHRTGFPNWRYETDGVLLFKRMPGEAYGYSGEGYEYVARFAEKKLRRGFEALAEALVFTPIGMRDTAYTGRPGFEGRIAIATGPDGKPLDVTPRRDFVASDDLHTTAGDYARFMISLMNGEGISEAIARDRERVQLSRKSELCPPAKSHHCPLDVGPGLGWEVFEFADERFLFHTGKDKGVFTLAYFSPTNRSGTVILTNGAEGARIVLPLLDGLDRNSAFVKFLHVLAGN
jgi:CubicO group peptidase (beta-lactamase class C family)